MAMLTAGNSIISRPLDLTLEQSTLNVHGFLTYTDDIPYWTANHVAFPFQNQSLALVFRGHHFTLDGHDTGGIDGQGQAWYDDAKTEGNKYGRPMSLAISYASDIVIKNWTIKQPQFWACLIAWSKNVLMKDCYVNATSFNPEVRGSLLRHLCMATTHPHTGLFSLGTLRMARATCRTPTAWTPGIRQM